MKVLFFIFPNAILGKQRSKTEAAMNTNRPNPGGHERKIMAKLMNAEKNNQGRQDKSWLHKCLNTLISTLFIIWKTWQTDDF